jgi:hypothetical protein
MQTFGSRCLPVVLGILLATTASGAEADNDPWAPFRFLIGEWTGEGTGQPGQGSGSFVLQPELEGKVLVRRNHNEIPRGTNRPPAIHEDLMVVYPGEKGQPAKAIYWDNEGHVIQYTVNPSPDRRSLVFLSQLTPSQPRFRLTYTDQGLDRVTITFAIAPPGKPEEFKTYLEGSARRKPRSNVGLSLPRGYLCYRAAGPIAIDGKLEETAWQRVPWTEAFLDIEGHLKPIPRLETRAKMLWDDEYLYIGAYLEEPHVWGALAKHDAVIFQDNDFEIFMDPDGDNHEYYELEINALNTEWDLFLKKPYRDGGPAQTEWEIHGLKTGVHVAGTLNDPRDKDEFWSVEFALPWKVLAEKAHRPAPPRDRDQWRINFSRVEWEHEIVEGKYQKIPKHREDNWVWSPQGFVDMHRPEFWGIVQFSTGEPGTVTFRPDPATPIRERLIEVYNHQKQYQEENQRWAESVEELGLRPSPSCFPEHSLTIKASRRGFDAEISFKPAGGEPAQIWSINQESRITHKP